MKIHIAHRGSIILLVSGISLLTASCGSLLTNDRFAGAAPNRSQHPPLQQRIVQLYFGRNATYGLCVEPACPAVTPKTVASSVPGSAPTMAPTALPAASTNVPPKPAIISPPAAIDAPPKREYLMLRFQPGASILDAQARQELAKMIPLARKADKIIIMGRTDNVGPTKANDSVALSRALHVRDYLRSRMKDVDNTIEIDAKGACCFISTNDTPDGRQANRRVEVVFTLRS